VQFDFLVIQGESLCRGLRSRLGGSWYAPEGIFSSRRFTRVPQILNRWIISRRSAATPRSRARGRTRSCIDVDGMPCSRDPKLAPTFLDRGAADLSRRRVLRDTLEQMEVGLLLLSPLGRTLCFLGRSSLFCRLFTFVPFMDRDKSRQSRRDRLDSSAICNVSATHNGKVCKKLLSHAGIAKRTSSA